MLLPPEVAAVIQEVGSELGCHNDPRLLRSARSYTRLPCPSDDEDWAHCPHPAVCGAVVWRRTVAYRSQLLWSFPRFFSSPAPRVCRCCPLFSQDASRWRDSPLFLVARGIEKVPQDDRGLRESKFNSLADVLFVTTGCLLASLLRSVRTPSTAEFDCAQNTSPHACCVTFSPHT